MEPQDQRVLLMSKSIEELKKLCECYGLAHDVMVGGIYPGSASQAVSSSIQFLKANHADLSEQIKKLGGSSDSTKAT
jgi:mannose/fructose/N-acetylgalactosamine-specific phosphotransferase system component IIB